MYVGRGLWKFWNVVPSQGNEDERNEASDMAETEG